MIDPTSHARQTLRRGAERRESEARAVYCLCFSCRDPHSAKQFQVYAFVQLDKR